MTLTEVIGKATQCAATYGEHNPNNVARVVDMATTGDIPAGYTHLIFVQFGETGYIVSRNLNEQYKVEMCGSVQQLARSA